MDFEHGLNMARVMKARNDDIVAAIRKCEEAHHGVVALLFSQHGAQMEIEILDEDFDSNVRVFPGK